MIGYITKVYRKDSRSTPEKLIARRFSIQVVHIFNYKGHDFIVHEPRFCGKVTGFVGTHSKTGFLASNSKEVSNKIKPGEPCKVPIQYKTVEAVEKVIRENVDNYIKSGKDFDKLVSDTIKSLNIEKMTYIDLITKKLI